MVKKVLFSLTALLMGAVMLYASDLPVPPAEHPRLFIRSHEIPALREKMKSEEGKKIIRKLEKISVDRTLEEEAKETDRGFRYYFQMRGLTSAAQLDALDYLTNGNKKAARRAITSMLDSLQRTSFGTKKDLSRASGVMLMVGAVVYDWCYDQMTDTEKQAYIKEFVRIAKTMECGYPPKRTEPIAGHSSEWMILRDMLSAGIAIYDEYPQMYNYVIEMMFEDYVPVRNFIYKGQNYHQGTGYVTVRFTNDLISLWILDKMGAGAIYNPDQQYVLYDFIYRRRPDGQVLPAGDVNPGKRNRPHSYALPAMLASSYYQDEYLAYEYERNPNSIENHCLLLELLWRDFNLKGKEPSDLPLSRFSDRPFGWMIARTSWDKNAVIAEMKVNEQFVGNHQHLDAGSFQIYYKGPLAIDSGSYQGESGGYNSPHNKNYFKRTIAHNSLLVYDPNELFECWNYGGEGKTKYATNDGGQRMPGDKWDTCRSFESFLSESYTVGKTLAHGFGPDSLKPAFSYLKGDITKAYSSKVKDVRRSFVFLNMFNDTIPAVFITYDNIESADKSFKKYWLFHSIEKPELTADGFVVKRTKNGDKGKLYCQSLLPKRGKKDLVGGKGKEFWVFGQNYPNAALPNRPDEANERGEWRVEISPYCAREQDNFLNVMQVTDNKFKDFYKAQLIESKEIKAVVIADRVVIFHKELKALEENFSFNLKDSTNSKKTSTSLSNQERNPCSYKILVTDLADGIWKISKNGVILGEYKSENSHLYFEGGEGIYVFKKL